MARQVATPNFEQMNFIKLAQVVDMEPVVLEYLTDKFSTNNPAKYFLGKMVVSDGSNKRGEKVNYHNNIINFDESENKPLNQIDKLNSENLVDFHHKLFDSAFPNYNRCDCSLWTQQNGKQAREYYKHFLVLYLRNGILFENFLVDRVEEKFTREVVLVALNEIAQEFGLRPLIVQLLPSEREENELWYWYPEFQKNLVENSK